MSNNDPNSEVLSLLRLVLTQVNTLTNDVQTLTANQQALSANQQALSANQQALSADVQILSADMKEVKTDVREIKSWANVTDNRLANMENKIVDFATQLTSVSEKVDSLDGKVEARLHDTRPMWEALNLRLNTMEDQLVAIKGNQGKSEQASEEFRQEVLLRFKQLQNDLQIFRRHIQIDVLSFAKDLVLFEQRLEKIESKLEIKN
jgi:chromosome segregation ATPase